MQTYSIRRSRSTRLKPALIKSMSTVIIGLLFPLLMEQVPLAQAAIPNSERVVLDALYALINGADGTTYANGSGTAFWSFTTAVSPPYAFNKSSPVNGTTNQSISPTLTWGASSGAILYEYCYDTTNDNACTTWTSNGASTSDLSGLAHSTTYYWHVRAINADGTTYANGSGTAFWSFTTASVHLTLSTRAVRPMARPANTQPTLTWGSSSGATRYEYCYDTTNDNACTTWTSNGASTSDSLSGLAHSTTYYWHVRAINADGTTYAMARYRLLVAPRPSVHLEGRLSLADVTFG